jgi:hypothetical protein
MNNPHRRGQKSIQVYVDEETHKGFKVRLCREGKSQREIIEKFIRVYSGVEDENEEENPKTTETDRPRSR